MFEFGWPWAFWLLPLPLIIIFLLPPIKQKRSSLAVPFFQDAASISEQKPQKGVFISKRSVMQYIVMWMVWVLLIGALLSPQLVGEPELKVKTARNLLLLIDLSGSMTTKDWVIDNKRTTRWEAVQQVMREFIEKREGDRLGLVLFATQPYLQVPFTTDLQVVQNYLLESEVGMAGEKTAMGNAIGFGIQLFQTDTVDSKVMILLTDGVDSGSEINPIQAARTAALDSIIIYTIGIGDPAGQMFDLDEKTLTTLAKETNGKYFRAIDIGELQKVYETLEALEPIEFEEESYTPATLLYYYPLLAAFMLVIIYHLIKGTFTFVRNGKLVKKTT